MAHGGEQTLPPGSIYRHVIRDFYLRVIRGEADIQSMTPLIMHILNVYILHSEWNRREFAKLLRDMLVSRLGMDEATAREAAERLVETGDVALVKEYAVKFVRRRKIEEEKVAHLEQDVIEAEAEAIANRIIIEAAESFLKDIGVL